MYLSIDGTMEQGKPNDSVDRVEGRPSRVSEYVYGKVEWDGNVGSYSYHLVYTQESVRLLDLRLVSVDEEIGRHIRGVLRARIRREGYYDSQVLDSTGELGR